LITRPEESNRLRRVVCDQETSKNEEAKARYWAVEKTIMGCKARKTNTQRPVVRRKFAEKVLAIEI
jgi:hypothetical protein